MVRKSGLLLLLIAALAFAQAQKPAAKKMSGEHMNKSKEVKPIAASDLQWGPAPPSLPAGAQMAVVEGNPMGPGNFIVRLKAPDGYHISPHWHPTAENVTVLSGQLQFGMGKKEDSSSEHTLSTGDFISMPAHHPHYVTAKGESVVQIQSTGPFKVTYVDPNNDPRKSGKKPSTKQ